MLVFQEDRQIFIVVPLVLDKRTRTQIYKGKIRTDKGFIAGGRYEHTTYQIFMSGSTWPTIDKS